jgi:hypothetical protein
VINDKLQLPKEHVATSLIDRYSGVVVAVEWINYLSGPLCLDKTITDDDLMPITCHTVLLSHL